MKLNLHISRPNSSKACFYFYLHIIFSAPHIHRRDIRNHSIRKPKKKPLPSNRETDHPPPFRFPADERGHGLLRELDALARRVQPQRPTHQQHPGRRSRQQPRVGRERQHFRVCGRHRRPVSREQQQSGSRSTGSDAAAADAADAIQHSRHHTDG